MTRERFSVGCAVVTVAFDHPSHDPGNSASPRLNPAASHPSSNWNLTWQSMNKAEFSRELGKHNILGNQPVAFSVERDPSARWQLSVLRHWPHFA